MATAETETPRDEQVPSGGAVYDGFISYSHAADDLLAPRLQAGLQRFAKPWWKRRALRIFRDESSLSANPHLWSSISDALDQSAWFVLLLSPEAAESPWVNNEVEYWLEHKDPERIIPVLTDGEFSWFDEDLISDAAPPALEGAFSGEPRWVDLRFARSEEQLDLNNPRFSAAIADVASAIRGVPKDELESEEVRQHRRTVRSAWAAGAALVVLLVLSAAAAVFAYGQRNEAQTQQTAAEASATEAQRQAALAEAGELAASAASAVERDPELALLLTLSSFASLPPGEASFPEGKVALRNALDRHRLSTVIAATGGERPSADFMPDGRGLVVSADAERTVTLVDQQRSEPVWVYEDLTTIDTFFRVDVSPDGRFVAVSVLDEPLPGEVDTSQVVLDEEGNDPFPGRVVVLDATDGSLATTIEGAGCPLDALPGPAFSPDGSLLIFSTGTEPCFEGEAGSSWIALIDTTTWNEVDRIEVIFAHLSLPDDMETALLIEDGAPEMVTWPGLETVTKLDYPGLVGTVYPDGTHAVLDAENSVDNRPALVDAATGAVIDRLDSFEGFVIDLSVSPQSDLIAAASTTGVFIWRASGELLHRFGTPTPSQVRFSPDGTTVVSSHADGTVRLWDITERTGTPIGLQEPVLWINADKIVDGGPNTGVIGFTPDDVGFAHVEASTGETLEWLDAHPWADQLPDGRFVLHLLPEDDEVGTGPLVIWDPADGTHETLDDCVQVETEEGELCESGEPRYGVGAVASQDGTQIGALADVMPGGKPIPFRVWDAETGTPIRTIEVQLSDFDLGRTPFFDDESLLLLEGFGGLTRVVYRVFDPHTGQLKATLDDSAEWRGASAVSTDGGRVYLGSTTGEVYEYDTSTWTLVRSWQAQDGRLRGLALSPDGSQILSTGEDGHVMIWALTDLRLVDRIPMPFPSDAVWVDQDTLGVALARGEWQIITLRDDELLAQARSVLTRSYSEDECRLYNIDPCPTLDDTQSGSP